MTVDIRVHASIPRSRWEVLFYSVLLISGAATVLSQVGCQSSGNGAQASAKPNFGPPIQDVRTEAKIVEMENDYTAAKNSQPTHQAEAAKKAKQQQDKEKAAKEAEKPNPEPVK